MTRTRWYLWSAPVLLVVLLVSIKMISVVLAGDAARSDFAGRDIDALRTDVSVLQILDVIEPGVTAFAAGDLDVLTGRLPEADRQFSAALASTELADSCPVRINLVLVRETLGDLGFRDGDRAEVIRRYQEAVTVAQEAPLNCFAGNDDPDEQRRALRADTLERLQRKLDLVSGPAAPPPPPPLVAAPPPPPVGAQVPVPAPVQPEDTEPGRRLGTGEDPGDLLRRLLDNANAGGESRE
ncbi:hypothetical protein BH11ACT6_BH11ACT6_55420 [soil metagenome]